MIKKTGEKFTSRYKLATATIYRGNTDALRIPGPDHPLYDATAPTTFDPIRVEAIDRDGHMKDPIEVYTDPDEGILWVLDGRGRFLDVEEVNRRRKASGRELVEPYLVPFNGDEKEAVARLREKNYHRRLPTPSGMARDLLALRKAGYAWDACARVLHQQSDDPEQWARKILPIAHCVPEVQVAIDAGDLPRSVARRFGGGKPDGSKALGRKEQLKLLAELLSSDKKEKSVARVLSPVARERARDALSNGATESLKAMDKMVARVAAAVLARVSGDDKALSAWPEVARIFNDAIAQKNEAKATT